jgi:uncharacterized protein involved in outer membrane biogenesis
MKKILLTIGICVLVLLAVAVAIVALNLDTIVKKSVETYGPQITKVSIKLDAMHIGLFTGSATVKGLVVGNPEGYKTPEAIRVGDAAVGVSPFSILSDKIVVRSIKIEAPEITFEGGLGGNNLSKIMDNVNEVAKNGGPPAMNTNTAAKTGAKPAKKIEVDDFLIAGAKVHVILTDMGGKELTLTLPEIHLTNLGRDTGGLTATELTKAGLQALINATTKAVFSAANDLGKDATGLGVDRIKKGLGGLFDKK